MIVFQDLTIFLGNLTADKMVEKIDVLLPTLWLRDKQRETELGEKSIDRKQYCYSTEKNPNLPCARLWLAKNKEGNLYVSNIVPYEVGELTYEQYNSILLSFVEVLRKDPSIKCDLTKANITLEDFMPQDVALKLRRFSGAANKSTGYGHPCDFERWLDFVVSFYRNKCERRLEWIRRWLNEEEKWTVEKSWELSCQLDYAIDVLDYYNKASR
jgi:hypothetical protein